MTSTTHSTQTQHHIVFGFVSFHILCLFPWLKSARYAKAVAKLNVSDTSLTIIAVSCHCVNIDGIDGVAGLADVVVVGGSGAIGSDGGSGCDVTIAAVTSIVDSWFCFLFSSSN